MTTEEGTAYAESLCARAEYAPYEIRQRLIRKGLSNEEISEIIKHLTDLKFIDEERFAFAFARNKMEMSHWGRHKIAYALSQRRIDRQIILRAINDLDENRYFSILCDLIKSRKGKLGTPDTYEGRHSLYRFASARGFESELIIAALRRKN